MTTSFHASYASATVVGGVCRLLTNPLWPKKKNKKTVQAPKPHIVARRPQRADTIEGTSRTYTKAPTMPTVSWQTRRVFNFPNLTSLHWWVLFRSFFFWDFVGLEPNGTKSTRRGESNALAGYTTGPSSICLPRCSENGEQPNRLSLSPLLKLQTWHNLSRRWPTKRGG